MTHFAKAPGDVTIICSPSVGVPTPSFFFFDNTVRQNEKSLDLAAAS